jgi:hypothetical protein
MNDLLLIILKLVLSSGLIFISVFFMKLTIELIKTPAHKFRAGEQDSE